MLGKRLHMDPYKDRGEVDNASERGISRDVWYPIFHCENLPPLVINSTIETDCEEGNYHFSTAPCQARVMLKGLILGGESH